MSQYNEPQKFIKRAFEVEAMRLTGSAADCHAVYLWIERQVGSFEPMGVIERKVAPPKQGVSIDPRNGKMILATPGGLQWVNLGWWIIKGPGGGFHACNPDAFAAKYAKPGDPRLYEREV
jgi:hypothetical protein